MTTTSNFSIPYLHFSDEKRRRKLIKDYASIVIGAFIIAIAYVFFITPHKIIPGGVYGISIILHYKTAGVFSLFPNGLPIGTTSLCFNIPLVIIASKIFGQGFLPRTIVTFVSTALFVDLLSFFSSCYGIDAIVKEDILLSCIYGSAILGFGVAMVLRAKGTSAGTDVLAKIFTRYTHVPIGYTLIIVDSIIVVIGLIAFGDWKIPMYSLFTVFVYGKAVDIFMQGLSFDKAIFIISDKNHLISEKIINNLHRGGTFFHGKGMYNGTEKEVIFTVINSRQVVALREYIHQIDPKAFITIINATEILGEGFHSIEDVKT
ncbi:MAG: YitT family protein [Bacteroidales bacterium]|jgi:uncharacterized membrane-anchored protein YitT (DUF2179 family)|nr:YitT family protein [Bacteroidales bacterium]